MDRDRFDKVLVTPCSSRSLPLSRGIASLPVNQGTLTVSRQSISRSDLPRTTVPREKKTSEGQASFKTCRVTPHWFPSLWLFSEILILKGNINKAILNTEPVIRANLQKICKKANRNLPIILYRYRTYRETCTLLVSIIFSTIFLNIIFQFKSFINFTDSVKCTGTKWCDSKRPV
jgi:hypothetical protein